MKQTGPKITDESIIESSMVFARQKMIGLKPSHGWDHVARVMRLSEKISMAENADSFVVKVSSILHDIARDIEDTSNGEICHAEMGGKISYDFLTGLGLDIKRAEHISRCIKEHRYRNSLAPSTIEARILYDADKLDSIGAIGIGRAFLFSGEVGAKVHNDNIDIFSTSAYSEEDTAYREYMVKLRHIKGKMLTAEGARMAESRDQFMKNFFKRLQEEYKGLM